MGATIDDEVQDRPDSYRWLPYSHAAACVAFDRLDLVAVSDVDTGKMEAARERYRVPRGYIDYREMIEAERPDLLCIATRPASHAEAAIFAAGHGARAIYCEKPLCCSMEEADAMVEACESSGVHFNYGTQRRYIPVYRKLRELIDTGAIGQLQAVVAHCGAGAALWTHTHTADMLMYLAGDPEVDYVQGTGVASEQDWEGDRLTRDPGITAGYVRFRNGVHGYLVASPGHDYEICGDEGTLRTINDGTSVRWLRRHGKWKRLEETEFPEVPGESGTVNGLRELVAALDGHAETTGGIRRAQASQEIVLGLVESHRQGGVRVPLPLTNRQLTVRPEGW
jgi:predicted dehydrogenase